MSVYLTFFFTRIDSSHIKPVNCQDFDKTHMYYVYWRICQNNCKPSSKCCSMYKAYIVALGTDEKSAQENATNRNERIKFPKNISTSETSHESLNVERPPTFVENKKEYLKIAKEQNINLIKNEMSTKLMLNNRKRLELENINSDDQRTKVLKTHNSVNYQNIRKIPKVVLSRYPLSTVTQNDNAHRSSNSEESSFSDSQRNSPSSPILSRSRNQRKVGCSSMKSATNKVPLLSQQKNKKPLAKSDPPRSLSDLDSSTPEQILNDLQNEQENFPNDSTITQSSSQESLQNNVNNPEVPIINSIPVTPLSPATDDNNTRGLNRQSLADLNEESLPHSSRRNSFQNSSGRSSSSTSTRSTNSEDSETQSPPRRNDQNDVHGDSESTDEGNNDDLENEDFPMIYSYHPRLYKLYNKRGLMVREDVQEDGPPRYYCENGKIYLGLNRYVPEDIWTLTKKKDLGIFLRDTAVLIFKNKLVYSCVGKVKGVKQCLDKPIKLCCPKKVELYLSLFKDHLDTDARYTEMTSAKKRRLLKEAIRKLSIQIRDLRQKKIKLIRKENKRRRTV